MSFSLDLDQGPTFFWGELIDKYITMNMNSKKVFTDYVMLKLVFYICPVLRAFIS